MDKDNKRTLNDVLNVECLKLKWIKWVQEITSIITHLYRVYKINIDLRYISHNEIQFNSTTNCSLQNKTSYNWISTSQKPKHYSKLAAGVLLTCTGFILVHQDFKEVCLAFFTHSFTNKSLRNIQLLLKIISVMTWFNKVLLYMVLL